MDIGERISKWREAKGMTQKDLARAAGVTLPAVYQWEHKDYRTPPALRHLVKVVRAFGISMERFYGRIPKSKAARRAS